MKRIWLFRHGESRAQTGEESWIDPALTEQGRRQAAKTGEHLAGMQFDRICISPLRRARESYEVAQPKGTRVAFDIRLVECSYGRTYDPLLPYATPAYAVADGEDAWILPACDRVEQLIRDLRVSRDQSVLLIGHWAFFSMCAAHVLGVSPLVEPFPGQTKTSLLMDNAALSLLVLDHERYGDAIVLWNQGGGKDCSDIPAHVAARL